MKVDQEEVAFDNEARRCIYDHVMNEGLPPTVAETASALSTTPNNVAASFQRLADGHILVLQRGSGEILMANPFSAVPTPFLVRAGDRSWYGNCIWDAMGIPAMLKQDATIEASCGCCGTAMHLAVADGSLEEASGIAHFAIPAAHWWDDIVFQLKTMLLFWSEEHVEKWCGDWKLPRGSVLSLDRCWRMAEAWYGPDRREPEWRRRTVVETEALFTELGLTSPFWHLPR